MDTIDKNSKGRRKAKGTAILQHSLLWRMHWESLWTPSTYVYAVYALVKCDFKDLDGWQDVFITELRAAVSVLGCLSLISYWLMYEKLDW